LTGFANLYLGPGNYYFSSLAFNDLTSIHLVNLTAGSPISIYSTGDISGSLFLPTVNGVNWSSADTALASNVLFETLETFRCRAPSMARSSPPMAQPVSVAAKPSTVR
jgi:hypothetical protein